MKFLQYIAGLAVDGETALITHQRIKGKAPVYYGNGAPHADFIAYLPDAKITKDGAWYINTGSFIVERFARGKPRAKAANVEYVLFMVLDDVGTKSKAPPLEPTWIIETSPGNFQYGYAFEEQPTKGAYTAAMRAIAAAGYTDPGALNAVRNCRLPGSPNLKRGRDMFEAVLTAFNPERTFTLEQICSALDVTPGEALTDNQPVTLDNTGDDAVLDWLNANGLVLAPMNGDGWVSVVCPNNAEHSDGDPAGRYLPRERGYFCFHGHCEDLSSQTFLKWVADNGGPLASHGEHVEKVTARLVDALDTLADGENVMPEIMTEQLARVRAREAGRIAKTEWFDRYVYGHVDDFYFDLVERQDYSRRAFDALYRHVPCTSIHSGRKVNPSLCFDENRTAAGGMVLAGVTYSPGDGALVERDGRVFGNRWSDGRPVVTGEHPTPTRWLDHCARLIPDEKTRSHVWDMMAYKLQNPAVKINHAVLHGGVEGCGKDTMWTPFLWALCGPHERNKALVNGDNVSGSWGYHLESEVIVLNELKSATAIGRRELAAHLKPVIAAPPHFLPVNRKGQHPYNVVNRALVLAWSNEHIPLELTREDRRWLCIYSDTPRMTAEAAREMWAWFKHGGYEACAAWLRARDVSAFDPGAVPMMTEFKQTLIENSLSTAEGFIVDLITRREGPFTSGVVAGPWHTLCALLQQMTVTNIKMPPAALLHALTAAGWVNLGRIGTRNYPTKKHIYAAPDIAAGTTPSKIREMVERRATTLHAVK